MKRSRADVRKKIALAAKRVPANLTTETFVPRAKVPVTVGIAAGFPSVLNVVLGTWGTASAPWFVKVSGMYTTNVRGIQIETGLVFHRSRDVRQYIGVEFITFDWTYDFITINGRGLRHLSRSGVGPSYGISAYGLIAQIGAYYGPLRINRRPIQTGPNLSLQIGWSREF